MKVRIYTICTHPDRASGVDKIERCAIFIDRRTYKLPFEVSTMNPTEAMLRNNCYGIELVDAKFHPVWFKVLRINWSWWSRKGVRGEFNLNKRLLSNALSAVGVKVLPPDFSKPPAPAPLIDEVLA